MYIEYHIEFPSNVLVDLRLLLFDLWLENIRWKYAEAEEANYLRKKSNQSPEKGIFLEDPAYDNPRFMVNGMSHFPPRVLLLLIPLS